MTLKELNNLRYIDGERSYKQVKSLTKIFVR